MEQALATVTPIAADLALKAGEKVLNKIIKNEEKAIAQIDSMPTNNNNNTYIPRKPTNKNYKKQTTTYRNSNSSRGSMKRGRGGSTNVPLRYVNQIPHNYYSTKYGRRKINGNFTDSIRIQGRDLVGPIQVQGNAYFNIFNQPLNPLSVQGTRLSQEAALWQKYKYNRVKIIYSPSVDSTHSGMILVSHLDDPEFISPSMGSINYVQSMSEPIAARSTQIFKPCAMSYTPPQDKEYYIQPDVEGEDRLTVQSIIKVIEMVTSDLTAGTQIGMLYIEFDITLYERAYVSPTSSMATWQQIPVKAALATPTNTSYINIWDQGGWNPLKITLGTGSPMVGNIFEIVFNFDLGYMKAMKSYFFKGATAGVAGFFYENVQDVGNSGAADAVSGSALAWSVQIPGNAVMWYNSNPGIDPTMKSKKRLNKLKNRFTDKDIELLFQRFEELKLKSTEESDEEQEVTTTIITTPMKKKSSSRSREKSPERGFSERKV